MRARLAAQEGMRNEENAVDLAGPAASRICVALVTPIRPFFGVGSSYLLKIAGFRV